MSYFGNDTNQELSFGNENFGDNIVTHKDLVKGTPYTIRMNQYKETNGYYLFAIEVNEVNILQETNRSPYFSSSTNVYFSKSSDTSLGNDATVEDIMIFNGKKDGNYHGMYFIFVITLIYCIVEKL